MAYRGKKCIYVCKVYNTFGPLLCRALAGFHATTGCDQNPSFFRKGKKRPFNILCKSEIYQNVFYSLGDPTAEFERVFKVLETYVCHLYGLAPTKTIHSRNINELRYSLFKRRYGMIDVDEPFLKKSLKNVDASSLPPCEVELKQHILRVHYITNIWLNAHKTIPTDLIATECGWLEDLDESGEKSYKF